MGYLFHNLYNALEDLFQEVAETFENRLAEPQKFHRELSKRMAIEVPGIRPARLSSPSHAVLNELRAFRHVFRHAYDYELSAERLRDLKGRLLRGWPLVIRGLEIFQGFLRKHLEAGKSP